MINNCPLPKWAARCTDSQVEKKKKNLEKVGIPDAKFFMLTLVRWKSAIVKISTGNHRIT